jgi:hypothetical protein
MNRQDLKTTRELPAVVACGAMTASASASFTYRIDDPYAVTMTVTSRGAVPIKWIFGRHLLAAGIDGGFGSGDVVIAPAPQGPDLLIGLHGSHFAVVRVRYNEMVRFLHSTYELIPLGREQPHVDWDGLLDQLLAD